ncbi:MAG: adenosylcobinamide-GDP ribazoletransferase [Roseovarius sp.]|uniref:adenosylcobinamide-GDP ribazoletransferase n=1 Tax=Roseovarius sp. TaxID=1486281 RepID=UPI004059920C
MAGTDITHRVFGDLRLALGLLTRLPLPGEVDLTRGAAASWAWPVAGLAVALAGGIGIWLTSALPVGLSAAAGLAVMILVTGAMHEDGLADTADGLWGGWDRARRLEIMKDSRIGTYGVIALILSLLARWSLLVALIGAGAFWPALVAAALLSRVPMVFVMAMLDPARPGGLSRAVGQPPLGAAWGALALALIPALLLCGGAAVWAVIGIALLTLGIAAIAQAKIGGQTGDILGASQQLAEIAALAVLTAAVT